MGGTAVVDGSTTASESIYWPLEFTIQRLVISEDLDVVVIVAAFWDENSTRG
jgi:hypothetical protein